MHHRKLVIKFLIFLVVIFVDNYFEPSVAGSFPNYTPNKYDRGDKKKIFNFLFSPSIRVSMFFARAFFVFRRAAIYWMNN